MDAGFWLTGLWLVVLFVGGTYSTRVKSELLKGVTIGALFAIPATYILVWALG